MLQSFRGIVLGGESLRCASVAAAALACGVLLLSGCDGNDALPLVAGDYEGSFTYEVEGETFSEDWSLSLSEDGSGRITGTGFHGAKRVSAEGEHDHPDIWIDFYFVEEPREFTGRLVGIVSDDGRRMEGVVTISILISPSGITLTRKG